MQRPSQQAAASTLDPRVRQPRLESKRRRRADAGEILPLPVFRYRRLRIQWGTLLPRNGGGELTQVRFCRYRFSATGDLGYNGVPSYLERKKSLE